MRILLLTLLLSLAAFPLRAADSAAANPDDEIVYRVNLGRADDVLLLLKEGQDANRTDANGVPLLALAAARKDNEGINVVKALLGVGADIDKKDREGQTALFYAARQGNKDIVQYLLENKASYYQTDNRGDIARTIAHRAGHKEIVETMDGFVKGETEKVNQQYEDLNTTIKKRYKQVQAEQLKADEAQQQKQQEQATPPQEPVPVTPAAAPPKTKTPAKKGTVSPEAEETAQELSYHTCAFQYWSYCRAAKQTIELSPEELEEAITSHREQIGALSRKLTKKHKVGNKYVKRVTDQSKKHIFNRLAAMPSKTYRFEHGVGKLADVEERCRAISMNWQEPPPTVPVRKATSRDSRHKAATQNKKKAQKKKKQNTQRYRGTAN